MLTEGQARRAFELLDATGLLAQVLPEVARDEGRGAAAAVPSRGRRVGAHAAAAGAAAEPGCSTTLAWGALLHDVGKPATFAARRTASASTGTWRWASRIGGEICRRLRFSNDETRADSGADRANHMRFGDVAEDEGVDAQAVLPAAGFEEHLALHRLDVTSSHNRLELYDFAKQRFGSAPEEEVRPRLLVTGADLIAAGYRPGPGFREMLDAAEDAQLEGAITTTEEGLALVREMFGLPPRASNVTPPPFPLPPRESGL